LAGILEHIAPGPLDWLALLLFVLSIYAYGRFADHGGTTNLNAHMRHVRRRWMLRYLERDDRVLDSIFTGHSMNSISLFSSATLLVVVALLGLLGNSDLAYRLASQSTFITNTTGALFQVKLIGVICVFIYGFYRFTWALLQYNYLLALTASAPLTGDLTPETASTMADKLSVVLNAAVTSFHSGFRTYYYGLAWVGWFFHPLVFVAAILFVTFILVYRQIYSPAAIAIAAYAEMLQHTDTIGKDGSKP
jgi:uncharacterized membrane protein